VHGFLGPNGAGKSTTIRVLLGLLRADAGTATVLGLDPWRDSVQIHRRIAHVPGDVDLWPSLTGGEAIDVLLRLRGAGAVRERDRLLREFELDPRRRCRSYSKGNRQKVALVAAFAAPADLYILDEPTSGLDPLMETVFQAEIRRVRDAGATVLLSSHILSEVDRLCSTVSIIRDGAIVESGSLDDLRHLSHTTVSYRGDPVAGIDVHDLVRQGDRVTFSVAPDQLGALLAALATTPVDALSMQPPTLDELFLRHYGSTADEDGGADHPDLARGRHRLSRP
jgi:ABC-2 type transport system ATP-binding protein